MYISFSFITGMTIGVEWVELDKDSFIVFDLLIFRVAISFN